MPLPRLSERTLPKARPGVARPAYDRSGVTTGIVHVGPGAFFRAHQAAYADDLLGRDPRWGIAAVSLRSAGVRDALAPQDGLYTLAQLDEHTACRVLGSVREVLVAPEQPQAVFARLTAPRTQVVTLTITEKGYCLAPDGGLDLDHPDIAHDLRQPDVPTSALGWITTALRRRRHAGAGGLTVISCDNLPDNGVRLKQAVLDLARAWGDADLPRWIEDQTRFPRTMVDSITPATDDALRARVRAELGLEDRWPVQREAFTQWVIERLPDMAGPDWESAGATVAETVAPYERAKLRLLNGAHSTLAYAGLLAGFQTVRDAIGDPRLAGFVGAMMTRDIVPSLAAPTGFDLCAYVEAVLRRFANPEIRHNLSQIAWDGSQKLPVRLLGTVQDALAAGRPVARLVLPLAAWMHFVRQTTGQGVRLVDPLADRLADVARNCTGAAGADIARFLELESVFPPALVQAAGFRGPLAADYELIGRRGILEALEDAAGA